MDNNDDHGGDGDLEVSTDLQIYLKGPKNPLTFDLR